MAWRLTPQRESVIVGNLTARGAARANRPTYVTGLLPGLMTKDVPAGEMPYMANTFVNYFMAVGGNYPASDFRAPGWVRSSPNQWWSNLTSFILATCEAPLKRYELFDAVKATGLGLDIHIPNFFAILERYNPHSGTFFTPVGEMGLSLHEMWEVSKLPMGSLPYEEYFPCDQELR